MPDTSRLHKWFTISMWPTFRQRYFVKLQWSKSREHEFQFSQFVLQTRVLVKACMGYALFLFENKMAFSSSSVVPGFSSPPRGFRCMTLFRNSDSESSWINHQRGGEVSQPSFWLLSGRRRLVTLFLVGSLQEARSAFAFTKRLPACSIPSYLSISHLASVEFVARIRC